MLSTTNITRNYRKAEEITVGMNNDVIQRIAKAAVTALLVAFDNITRVASREQLEECFIYALKVVLYQDSGAKPCHELIPTYLTDITKSLNGSYRGVSIRVAPLDMPKRPDSYDVFLDVMAACGLPCDKVGKVNPSNPSDVMTYKEQVVDDCVRMIGIMDAQHCDLDDILLRAMLTVSEKEQEKLDKIIGFCENEYLSRDELIRFWAISYIPTNKKS